MLRKRDLVGYRKLLLYTLFPDDVILMKGFKTEEALQQFTNSRGVGVISVLSLISIKDKMEVI